MARVVAIAGFVLQAGLAAGNLQGLTSAKTCGALFCAQTAVCCDQAPAALCGSPGSTCCYNPGKTVANLCAQGSQCDAATGFCHAGGGALPGSNRSIHPQQDTTAKVRGAASEPVGPAKALPKSSRAPALRGSSISNVSAKRASFAAASADDHCWIHQGCSSTPGYSNTGSMGPGWYCTDGMYVDVNTAYDSCSIHEGCTSGVKYDGGEWICNDGNQPGGGGALPFTDGCYIHQGCSAGAGYNGDGTASLGNGWYCMDGQFVDANTKFDACAIHQGCTCGVSYQIAAWVCSC